jgi:hypothetical protein
MDQGAAWLLWLTSQAEYGSTTKQPVKQQEHTTTSGHLQMTVIALERLPQQFLSMRICKQAKQVNSCLNYKCPAILLQAPQQQLWGKRSTPTQDQFQEASSCVHKRAEIQHGLIFQASPCHFSKEMRHLEILELLVHLDESAMWSSAKDKEQTCIQALITHDGTEVLLLPLSPLSTATKDRINRISVLMMNRNECNMLDLSDVNTCEKKYKRLTLPQCS